MSKNVIFGVKWFNFVLIVHQLSVPQLKGLNELTNRLLRPCIAQQTYGLITHIHTRQRNEHIHNINVY
jgi:hypothetical protein